MDVTKAYKFIRFGTMDVTRAYKFIGFGAMDVTKAYKSIGFGGAMDAPHTPKIWDASPSPFETGLGPSEPRSDDKQKASLSLAAARSTCQAIGHGTKSALMFAPWGAPAHQTPRVGGLPRPKPPGRRWVWGAGAPQKAKNNIKYRPKDSYQQLIDES